MEYHINCADIHSREEFHRILAQTLQFPEWYGNNLDALYDCLTDIREQTHLYLENWDTLPPVFRGFLAVFDDAEQENLNLTVTYQPSIPKS